MQITIFCPCSASDFGTWDLEFLWCLVLGIFLVLLLFAPLEPIRKTMKVMMFVFLALCFTGCASSKYSTHPQAALIGPGYLETAAKYPPDRATQFYYPGFSVHDFELSAAASAPLPKPDLSPAIQALLTQLRQPTQQVKDITGKGYPCLEKTGMRLFTSAEQEKHPSHK